jgi:gamma-glutamyl-gamma-aminobutyrate hydrolase PuuD
MKSIVVGTLDYQALLRPYGEVTHFHPKLLNNLGKYDTIMFTGGADINPDRYGEATHPTTHCNDQRDTIEFDLFTMAKRLGLNMIGICRGGQLLCVANGDRLIQDVNNHRNCEHHIYTDDGQYFHVKGDHHQMMAPDHGEVVAWSKGISNFYMNGSDHDFPFYNERGQVIEPEVVWYEKSRSLAIQFHPEWAGSAHPSRGYFRKLVERYILQSS